VLAKQTHHWGAVGEGIRGERKSEEEEKWKTLALLLVWS